MFIARIFVNPTVCRVGFCDARIFQITAKVCAVFQITAKDNAKVLAVLRQYR